MRRFICGLLAGVLLGAPLAAGARDVRTRSLLRAAFGSVFDTQALYDMGVTKAAPAPAATPWTNAELTAAIQRLARHGALLEIEAHTRTTGETWNNPEPGDIQAERIKLRKYRRAVKTLMQAERQ